ncbi:MGMT family protein [Nocardioides acrostichi]|uniref:MGMT family protein n=1 Tax=Nocardioides acrostichi TaxID=2784339 RepID=A0A930UYX8_9ACTN|nr:MGMT family protein [Nocardioides acrostichi]MBF4160682.1 MGMT family protein [Nocardioides acrostichi]
MRHPEDWLEDVLGLVEHVPAGHVTTYGAIAAAVGRYGPRRVGAVMAEHGAGVPWWRVVRADGSLPPSHDHRADEQYRREHTPRRANGRIDMPRAFWDPLDAGAPR